MSSEKYIHHRTSISKICKEYKVEENEFGPFLLPVLPPLLVTRNPSSQPLSQTTSSLIG